MGSTRPNPTHVGWVGSNFFDLPWWVGSKNPLNPTQPNPCTLLVLGCIQNLLNGDECPKSIGYDAFNTLLNNVFIHYFYKNKVKLSLSLSLSLSLQKSTYNTINLCLYKTMNYKFACFIF